MAADISMGKYVGGLYLILVRSEEGAEINQQCMVTALLIGVGTAILKAVMNVFTNYLLSYIVPSNITGTGVKGVRNCGFGDPLELFRKALHNAYD